MRAARLNKWVELLQKATVRDDFGQEVETWNLIDSVWASVETLSGKQVFDAQQHKIEINRKILIRYRDDIAEGWRVRHGSKEYEVVVPSDPDNRSRQLYLMCKVLV